MGSDAHLIVVGGSSGLIDEARQGIDQLESRWSRFRLDSEISSLNMMPGTPVAVSEDTRFLVGRAIEAWRITGGGFDPLVLPDVIRAGYDRSDEQLPRPPKPRRSRPAGATSPMPAARTSRSPTTRSPSRPEAASIRGASARGWQPTSSSGS